MELNLQNRVAVVTGASRGIGRAIVEELLREQVKVIAGARHVQALEGLDTLAVAIDLSTPEGPRALINRAVAEHGGMDFLVNNVGNARFHKDGFASATDDDWDWHFQTNFMSAVRATRAALPWLIERRGVIVNISSVNAVRPSTSIPEYSALKAALNNLSLALAEELAPDVRVVTVSPGLTLTDLQTGPNGVAGFLDRTAEEHIATGADAVPMKRMGTPAEVAGMVAFVLSDRSAYTTGAEIIVDGGAVLS